MFNIIFKRLYKIRPIESIIISIPFLTIIFWILTISIIDLYKYKKIVYPQMKVNSVRLHFYLKNTLKRELVKFTSPTLPSETKLQSFYLRVSNDNLDKLNSNLPESGKKEYVSGYLKINDGTFQKVKVRYRGDSNYHWLYTQKSWRIKTKKDKLINGMRKFNLINPPDLATIDTGSIWDCVVYEIAAEVGLLTPRFYPIRFFLNGQYIGLYMYLDQVDESLLRQLKRMPGSIYAGEMVSGERLKSGVSALWYNEKYWQKIASRSSDKVNERDDISKFIDAISRYNDLEFYRFARDYLDLDKVYKYFALDVITGTPHHDYSHNNKYYFDPYKGKFEPIEWDVRFFKNINRKDYITNPLLQRLILNPILENERDSQTYKLMASKYNAAYFLKRYLYYAELIYKDLNADIFRDDAISDPNISIRAISVPFFMKDFDKVIDHFKNPNNIVTERFNTLKNIFNDSKCTYSIALKNSHVLNVVLKLEGNSGISIRQLKINNYSKGFKIFRDSNFNKVLDNEDTLIKNTMFELINENLYPGRKIINSAVNPTKIPGWGNTSIINSPLKYSFFIVNENKWTDIPKLVFEAYNLVTGQKVGIEKSEEPISLGVESDSIHPWKLSPESEKQTVVLNGSITIRETKVFHENQTVIIKPGTTIYIFPKKSLFFFGKVVAEGTQKKPIVFFNAKKEPYGVIAVQGKKANESRFVYCKFKGGSEDYRNLVYYSGQVNFHDVNDITIENCRFEKNYIGDDNLHIAYGTGIVRDSIFIDSNSDALDIDISSVELKNNIFINSGNDALDFMTTEAVVEDCFFINAGDKGISVGEETNGVFSNNLFFRCNIGVEVKDNSIIELNDAFIIDSNKLGINLYNKNWRYSRGGTINSEKVYIVGKSTPLKSDKKSTVNINEIIQTIPPDIHLESFWKDNVVLINNKDVFSTINPTINHIKGSLHEY